MDVWYLFEQGLNGVQFGLMLFLLAAGLTLIFGIMDLINLAHGSLYMVGAYLMASFVSLTGSFWMALPLALLATAGIGVIVEVVVVRRLYQRDHLSQVLATFGLILVFNELVRMVWGVQPYSVALPPSLSGSVAFAPGFQYPEYRLALIFLCVAAAAGLFYLVHKTKVGMWIRAGASNRQMATAMGVNIRWLFTTVFALGAALCALAGAALAPVLSIGVGMGESIIILAFVVVVIGGIGSIKGAFIGALLVGLVDTMGRAYLPGFLRGLMKADLADGLAPAIASLLVYVLMAAVLVWKPSGLFSARA